MREDDLKVRDLSTAQNPKATDFVMLITNMTNNVLEKCQLTDLRSVLALNNISDDENNALILGSDDKLYVSDLTENIDIVANNLTTLSNDVDLLQNDVNELNVKVDNYGFMPDYSQGVFKIGNTQYVAESDGWLNFSASSFFNSGTNLFINDNLIASNLFSTNYGISIVKQMIPIAKGDTYKMSGYSGSLVFYPCKGGV